MHDALGASGIFRAEHAAGKNELHRQEFRTLGDEQRRKQDCIGMGNDSNYGFWDNERLPDLGSKANLFSKFPNLI